MKHPYPLAVQAAPHTRPAGAGPRPLLWARRGLLALALLALAGGARAQTTNFAYTGGVQAYTVPAGITAVQVVATGASGGVYSVRTGTKAVRLTVE